MPMACSEQGVKCGTIECGIVDSIQGLVALRYVS